MRSFTKKNPPQNNSISELLNNPNPNIAGLRTLLEDNDFKKATQLLINLTDNAHLSGFIDQNRDTIKNAYTALRAKVINAPIDVTNFTNPGNFNGGPNANFPLVNTAGDILPALANLDPTQLDIQNALTGAGINNNMDTSNLAAPYDVPNGVVINIALLLVLNGLIDAAYVRSNFQDETYNVVNVGQGNGNPYGNSKPYLVLAQGLYCAFCESPLQNGHDTDVEHKIPKGTFPTVEKQWSNFVLACKRCNSGFKGTQYVNLEGDIINAQPALDYQVPPATPISANALGTLGALFPAIAARIVSTGPNDVFVARLGAPASEATKHTAAQAAALAAVTALNMSPSYTNLPASLRIAARNTNYAAIAVYNLYLRFAQENVIWPDVHTTLPAGAPPTSFEAFNYPIRTAAGGALVNPITLDNIQSNTLIQVEDNYQINIRNLNRPPANGGPDENNVQLRIQGIVAADAPATNIIEICGLNLLAANIYLDQRIIRRTKAWLQAMQQLKTLTEFHTTRFRELHNYYEGQLNTVNINYNPAANRNNVEHLRNDVPAQIVFDSIVGDLSIAANLPNSEINIDLATSNITTNPGGGTSIQIIPAVGPATNIPDNQLINSGSLTGLVTQVGGVRTITGSIKITSPGPLATLANPKIVFFKDAAITTPPGNPTTISLGANQAIISNSNDPLEIGLLETWDNNRADLLKFLNTADQILLDYIWENILDMVRLGGFYSTWVRTFQGNRPNIGGTVFAFDVDLVRRLEIKAKENVDDPLQFHGTDAPEIIQSL